MCQWVASSQELLGSYTRDKELFCRRLVTGDKKWIWHWNSLSKWEFTQWKEVDRRTFTGICKSASNWLHYGNSFSRIQTDCLWQTICIVERQLLVSITQNQHSSYSMLSSRNSDESCHLDSVITKIKVDVFWDTVYNSVVATVQAAWWTIRRPCRTMPSYAVCTLQPTTGLGRAARRTGAKHAACRFVCCRSVCCTTTTTGTGSWRRWARWPHSSAAVSDCV